MRSVRVDLVSFVIVVSSVVGDARANPFAATHAAADGGWASDGWVRLVGRGRRRPRGRSWLPGPPFSRYSAGGLINATAVR